MKRPTLKNKKPGTKITYRRPGGALWEAEYGPSGNLIKRRLIQAGR